MDGSDGPSDWELGESSIKELEEAVVVDEDAAEELEEADEDVVVVDEVVNGWGRGSLGGGSGVSGHPPNRYAKSRFVGCGGTPQKAASFWSVLAVFFWQNASISSPRRGFAESESPGGRIFR